MHFRAHPRRLYDSSVTRSPPQSRSLNYLWTVTASVLGAMEELEGAVQVALGANGAGAGGVPEAGGEQKGQRPPGGNGAQQATAVATAAESQREGQQSPVSAGDSVVLVVLGADTEKSRGQTRGWWRLACLGRRGRQQQERQQEQQPRSLCWGLWHCIGYCFSRHAWSWAQPLWPVSGTEMAAGLLCQCATDNLPTTVLMHRSDLRYHMRSCTRPAYGKLVSRALT